MQIEIKIRTVIMRCPWILSRFSSVIELVVSYKSESILFFSLNQHLHGKWPKSHHRKHIERNTCMHARVRSSGNHIIDQSCSVTFTSSLNYKNNIFQYIFATILYSNTWISRKIPIPWRTVWFIEEERNKSMHMQKGCKSCFK